VTSPGTAAIADRAVGLWFGHIDYLARVIGPRGSATAAEAEAARYAYEQFERAGLKPGVERFRSARSAWHPFALAMALALLAVAVYPLAGRATAAIALALIATVIACALREINLLPNPLRLLLPRGESQNVWAVVPSTGEPRQTVAIIGHLDSHRTPLLFRSLRWQRLMHVVVPAGFLAMVAAGVLFAIGLAMQEAVIYLIAAALAAALVPVLLLTLQADLTPYTHGANDNASGAGLLFTLAETLREQPLRETEVWLVATGCEEVGCYGAIAFFRAHRDALRDAAIIVVDTVGGPGSGPCYFRSEGMVLPHRYDPGLLALADSIASERPELGAYSRKMTEAYTEGLPAIQAGLRALTFCGFTPEHELPHWHQRTDMAENIDRDVLARNYLFVRELLQAIDGVSDRG
jgi:hypothetical protein